VGDDRNAVASPGAVRDHAGNWALVAECARLSAERAACERTLQKIDDDLNVLAAAPKPINAAAELGERLRRLTKLDPELRTQLHIIMGNIQLLGLEHDVSPQAERRLDAMAAAGSRLLEKIHDINLLSDKGANFSPSRIDTPLHRFTTAPGNRSLDVLVADDIEMNRDIAAAILRGAGHRVQTAEDGAAAVLMATTLDFDVILMDVRMPGVDGLEATRCIRQLRGVRGEVPVIALTAKVSTEEVAACRAAGMSGHLAKPFRHDTLREAVEHATARRAGIAHVPVSAIIDGVRSGLNTRQMRALIAAPAESIGRTEAGRAGYAWIDIVSPWLATRAEGQRSESLAEGCRTENGQVAVKLIRERQGAQDNLSDPCYTCAPLANWDQQEYHWLLYVESGAIYPDHFSAECELWRWNRGSWRSLAVPGASFSPDVMYRDGWRYCCTCDNATARVDIIEPKAESGHKTSIWRRTGTGSQELNLSA